jgi:Lrp/AsnC family leucine-responsive transcriptional regulator
MPLEERDEMILRELRIDSSRSISEIAVELELPRTTVQERIQRLVSKGVIKRFTIQQDYAKLGKPVTAFILISFLPSSGISQRQAAERLAEIPDIFEVHVISGEWDILVKARGETLQTIGELVTEKIRNVKGVERTLTCASFLSVKESP